VYTKVPVLRGAIVATTAICICIYVRIDKANDGRGSGGMFDVRLGSAEGIPGHGEELETMHCSMYMKEACCARCSEWRGWESWVHR
jgi:hypothetical protein